MVLNLDKFQHTVQTGLDLQRYIHQEFSEHNHHDSIFSASVPEGEIFNDKNNIPVFSITEEINKPELPIFYDVPIKIEETGEGFDPPTEIRTFYVPIENAINIPDSYDINVGTSFGYNKNSNKEYLSGSSSYDHPVTSVDAPIDPLIKTSPYTGLSSKKTSVEDYENQGQNAIQKVRNLKPASLDFSTIPFGSRLGQRNQYDIIK